jgi:mono/diheme cytochrome c family protein
MVSRAEAVAFVGFLAVASVLSLVDTILARSGQKPAQQIKGVAVAPIPSVEGADNFAAYCAVCHGPDAIGNGPAALAMSATVPDLTRLSNRHGIFSAVDVEQIIRDTGRMSTPAHGVDSMPIWGNVFQYEDTARSTLRIGNLVRYLKSIQLETRDSGLWTRESDGS